jgi:putative nucleotidyltransferase with HDIG domain
LQVSDPAFFDRCENPHLAAAIRAARGPLREHLFARALSNRPPTLLLDVLSDALIDRCAQAAADGDADDLADWAVTTCRARFDTPVVRSLFLAIGESVMQVLGDGAFGAIDDRLTRALRTLHAPEANPGSDAVDELDLHLADMVAGLESNDPMTAEHCRAVSAWCARIAHRLELSRAEAAFVARGGLIHDVGKSATPLEILQAPRALTESEWTIMRDHVLSGYDIVRSHQRLRDFSGVVRSHHERFDGAGYPDRLDRSRIPLAVRIVSVADAFNAMIGRRPYRRPFSPDRAIVELRRSAGTQFDPNVVAAMIDVVGGGRELVAGSST